jgi:two-component system chemotaxis response regulator CheB
MSKRAVRVFIVDDSAVSRSALRSLVEADGQAVVVGEAADGRQALEKIPPSEPDIVLMDIMMARMDGLEATRELMRSFPRPVLIVSDLVGRDADLNFKALQAGALDLLRKPSAAELRDRTTADRLRRRVRLLSEVPVVTRRGRARRESGTSAAVQTRTAPGPSRVSLVCIGASTGGPPAILRILTALGGEPRWPVLIVQHMTVGFTTGFVKWLGETSGVRVVAAEHGIRPRRGVVYVAAEDRHLRVDGRQLVCDDSPPLSGHRPSVDVLFTSVAERGFPAETIALLLTGMGKDGAYGLGRIRDAGGWTIAQDEVSSVVWGMPKAAVDARAAREVLSVDGIVERLRTAAQDGED